MIDVGNNSDVSYVGSLTERSAADFLNGVGRQMCAHGVPG